MQELGWWHAQAHEVGAQAHEVGAQAHARACAFPKPSEKVGAVIEGEHGSVKSLLSSHFVKEFSCLRGVCAGIYTYDHRVVRPRFPSAQRKALVPGLTLRAVHSVWESLINLCIAHLLLARCKTDHALLVLS